MKAPVDDPPRAALDDYVSAFEAAQVRAGRADLADFLPAPAHPLYRAVLRELVRVDLELAWDRGQAPSMRDYLQRFPELGADRAALQEIAFEEYRLRRLAGEPIVPDVYRQQYGVNTATWPADLRNDPPHRAIGAHAAAELSSWGESSAHLEPGLLLRELDATDPDAAQALAALPETECTFLDFRLISELGRGAFARVYLAQQGELADRLVALKISVDVAGESETLARLQHTHIVPIYSVHRAGMFQAVCMPYFGPITLADVLHAVRQRGTLPTTGRQLVEILRELSTRFPQGTPPAEDHALPLRELERLSYVDAVLWLAARLAEALEHAHERGILHRDLKPANVLLTDEGRPMLLDFNLSANTKLLTGAATAQIGGTLPYMAPEHLLAFESGTGAEVDARSDLYSLGVILYELLTGRFPFATAGGPPAEVLPRMLAERRAGAPPLRPCNRAISPAVESIVLHLLEPGPAQRYQTARELRTDLQRQLASRSLQHAPEPSLRERAAKWMRRHPRLSSPALLAGALAAVTAGVVAVTMWSMWWYERSEKEYERSEKEAANRQVDLHKAFVEELKKEAQNKLQQFRQLIIRLRKQDDAIAAVRSLSDVTPSAQKQQQSANAVARFDQAMALYDEMKQSAVEYLPGEEIAQLQRDVGELLYLRARSELYDLYAAGNLARRLGPACRTVGHGLDVMGVATAVVRQHLGRALEWNNEARACYPFGEVPRSLVLQQACLARLLGKEDEALRLDAEAERLPLHSAREQYLAAYEYAIVLEQHRKALQLTEAGLDTHQPFTWFLQALCHDRLGEREQAIHYYSTCLDLDPNWLAAQFLRGKIYLAQEAWNPACEDFTEVLRAAHRDLNKTADLSAEEVREIRRRIGVVLVYRARAWEGLEKGKEAIADLDAAERVLPLSAELYFTRARLHENIGNSRRAEEDFEQVRRATPTDAQGWACRGMVETHRGQVEGGAGTPRGRALFEAAVTSFRRALADDPRYLPALIEQATVLAKLHRDQEAVRVLGQAIDLDPRAASLRLSRAALYLRLQQYAAAQQDAAVSAGNDPSATTLFEAACIFARTSRTVAERATAVRLLTEAVRRGCPRAALEDARLESLHVDAGFRQLVAAARILDTGTSPARRGPSGPGCRPRALTGLGSPFLRGGVHAPY